ncbi:MAG: carbonic anhydrase [Solirubrobacteraceae bacterium]
MSATDDLLDHNRAYARDFARGDLAAPPRLRVAVLACMDARLDMSRSLGLHEGDVHVIRNAGGLVTDDAIRSLAISQHLMGTEEIMLVHHTRCGMQSFSRQEFGERMDRVAGQRPRWSAGGFDDLEGDVRESIEKLQASPFILHKESIRGFVYEVENGLLREVETEELA